MNVSTKGNMALFQGFHYTRLRKGVGRRRKASEAYAEHRSASERHRGAPERRRRATRSIGRLRKDVGRRRRATPRTGRRRKGVAELRKGVGGLRGASEAARRTCPTVGSPGGVAGISPTKRKAPFAAQTISANAPGTCAGSRLDKRYGWLNPAFPSVAPVWPIGSWANQRLGSRGRSRPFGGKRVGQRSPVVLRRKTLANPTHVQNLTEATWPIIQTSLGIFK